MAELRKILHIDMDAFFASVEQRDHLAYRGKPIAVGGRPDQRGAVAAASYEARQFGVHSALPSRIAQQRCPELIFVKPRFEVYRQVSQQIREVFHRYTDWVEPLSLDEAYLDVTENKRAIPSAMAIARAIKQDILKETHLTASAGVSINKFLAKMASGLNKPDGLTLIAPEESEAFVETLAIEKFHGIGEKTAAKMRSLGIYTGADLKQWPEADLVRRFGKAGQFYYRVARGQDERPVNPNRIRKSIGAEQSFATDLKTLDSMTQALQQIAAEVSERLIQQRRQGHTLTLKIKYASYRQVTRSRTLPEPIKPTEILPLAQDLLLAHLERQQPVRLLGITLSNLTPVEVDYVQLRLEF
ncbi:DNA polymerase IV [Pseudanabaena sp. FACHB-2040]|uniref:DNA polymerase IV n=1 Tax=Pseudanabaena sp. FACHB-2040 TaxID=2692859 RepID=UPI001682D640|nr:DNA polymerase IV [Pseudanabaena sp. FACHB-2040]MBD2257749.1 DNA polymerase IV [Pseudanabaena sp. FACHB-2040]